MKYSLHEIAAVCGGTVSGAGGLTVTSVSTDSRSNTYGRNTLFAAISGTNHDGHAYIGDMYGRGVRTFLVERIPEGNYPDAGFVVCKDTVAALQSLAGHYRGGFGGLVVGITGSNGKTITKEWLAQLAPAGVKVFRSPRSYNSQTGVALSLLMIEGDEDIAVIEAGISLPGEMERLEKMIRPEVGILTGIGDAHQENFESTEQKLGEKLFLFKNCKKIIAPESLRENLTGSFAVPGRVIFVAPEGGNTGGTANSTGAPDNPRCIPGQNTGGAAELYFTSPGEFDLGAFPFTDRASRENIALALKFYEISDCDMPPVFAKLPLVQGVAMRLETKAGIAGSTIINDSYNCDVNSLGIALDYLKKNAGDRPTCVILSDIAQSSLDKRALYTKVAAMVTAHGIDRFIGIGRDIIEIPAYYGGDTEFYRDTGDFLRYFERGSVRDSAVLIKGGRAFGFEKISHALEMKTHTTVLEVDLDKMIHNLNRFRARLTGGTKIMAMIKASGYGSGAAEVAAMLQDQRADYLAVAFADEGAELRAAGITMPVVVLNADPDSFDQMVENRLEPEIYSFNSLVEFSATVLRHGFTTYPVHIKLDTGMHRLGFTGEETARLVSELKRLSNLDVRSIFSHLAASDDSAHDDFTRGQIERFRSATAEITALFPEALRHISNSAGIERFPEAAFDMVRLGIGLYGFGSPGMELLPVSTFRSRIVQIKEIPAGDTVGYGRRGETHRPTTIATVPVGYADGLDRRLSRGKWSMLLHGRPAPIIGNVCMDTCMIDITGIDAAEGDEVVIFGPEGADAAKMAEILETIPYEILTGISARVRRIYTKE